jgi:nucleoside-diphosphate-sugar epimerase
MKVLIAGAAGYLGSWITNYLSKKGYSVIAFGRSFPDKLSYWGNESIHFLEGDISSDDSIAEIAELKPDAVIYTISLNHHLSGKDVNKTINTNVKPVWKLLDTLTKKELKKFVYFSTQQIYGKTPPVVIQEERYPLPVNAYGLTHLMCEQVLSLYNQSSDCQCVSIRLSNGFGAPFFSSCDCWWLVINDLCKSAFQKRVIKLQSDGSPQRDFIHISDISNAVDVLLRSQRDQVKASTYNLGSGKTFSIMELAQVVQDVYLKKYGERIAILRPKGSKETNQTKKFQYDINRIKSLGFSPQKKIAEGVNEIFDFIEKHFKL